MARGRKTSIWTAVRNNFVRKNAGIMKDELIAKELTRLYGVKISINAVRQQRRLLGIKKENGRGVVKIKK